jgi:hypothetical protein
MPGSVPTVRHGGRFYDGLGSNILVQDSVGRIIALYVRITVRDYVDRLDSSLKSRLLFGILLRILMPAFWYISSRSLHCLYP